MKRLIFFLLMFLTGMSCFAQRQSSRTVDPVIKSKNNALFLGPKVGVAMSSFSGQPAECDLFDGGTMGFSGGLAARARFGRATENSVEGTGLLGLGIELKYRQAKAKTIVDDDLSLGYLEIPLMLQVYPVPKSSALNGFYLEAGPELALLASKSPDVLSVSTTSTYQQVSYHTGDLKGGDMRLAVGVGYTLPNTGLDVNVRYHLGMSELSKNVLPTKHHMIELSLAWMFKLGKF